MATKTNGYIKGRVRQYTSPNTHRIDFRLRAVKTYDKTESHARRKEDSWEAMNDDVKGCNQEDASACREQTSV